MNKKRRLRISKKIKFTFTANGGACTVINDQFYCPSGPKVG